MDIQRNSSNLLYCGWNEYYVHFWSHDIFNTNTTCLERFVQSDLEETLSTIYIDLFFVKSIRVHLDTAYFAKNWKDCNKIIFKCVNSVVWPIFNENFVEKRCLWVLWTMHRTHWKSMICSSQKKKTPKRRRCYLNQLYPNAALISTRSTICWTQLKYKYMKKPNYLWNLVQVLYYRQFEVLLTCKVHTISFY